jgi:type VI secretion system protein ImpL
MLGAQGGKSPLLEQHGNEIEMSAAASALSNGIRWLLQQDFMNSAQTPPRLTVPILWDAAALNRTKALRDNYDRFVKERLPGLPPLERSGLQNAALFNLGQATANGVWRAATSPANRGQDELLLEIKSLRDAAPVLEQLLETVPRSATGLNGLRNLISMQALDLATRLNSDLSQNPPYKYSDEGLRNWDGVRPLSQAIWDADSPELLDDYLAQERDQMRSLATDYAQPLDAWLQNNGLQRAADFSQWTAIIRDLKDYDAKKPGNPLSVLETFIRTGEDKITPAQGCASATQTAAAGDYFIAIRSNVQAKIREKCATVLLSAYNTNAAAFFNQKLKGHFPFGPLPQGSSVSMADPADTGQFFTRIAQLAQPFVAYLVKNPVNADARAFVESADAARQMFAGGLNEGKPFADVLVSFRANQSAEANGNEIIDWEISAGDQKARFPGPEGGIRWHYGDPIRVQLRFAKDSPDLPQAGTAAAGMTVDERTVTWDFTTRWSLFEMLAKHSAQNSDFGSGSETSRGLLSFEIPIVADTSRIKGANSAAAKTGVARVYIRLSLHVTEGKDQKEVPLAPFPQQAPAAQPAAGDSAGGGSGLPPGKSILE